MDRLKGKVAIITGAGKGLGKAMAIRFANEGAKVITAVRRPLDYTHNNIECRILDVANYNDCEPFMQSIANEIGKVDILVNNAGITRDALTKNLTEQMWDDVIATNLKGVFNLTRVVGVHMEQNGVGSIINISSIVGEYGNIGQANYSASKAGVIGMTKTWAKEFSRKGANVRVNAIAPGYIMTDILKTVPEDLLKKFASLTMLGRLGQPEEVANVALFLASDEASYITGHVLDVNGGMRL